MSDVTAPETYASGRYSKRKRTQVTYHLDELDVSDSESDLERPQLKKSKATTVSRPLSKRKIFPFMQLPAEIRNLIYGYALIDPFGIHLVGKFIHKRRTVERISAECQDKVSRYQRRTNIMSKFRAQYENYASLVPSLLAVSKQVHREGLDILYSNEFIMADSFALYAFLINLGPAKAKHLKTIRLMGWGYGRTMKAYNHSCFAVLVYATNITALHIDAEADWYSAVKRGADQIYRDLFPWLEAVGIAKGKFDAAVDVLHLGDEYLSPYCSSTGREVLSRNQEIEEFKAKLGKLLGAQQKRVMAKTVKKRKVTKDAVTGEL
ncbi:hypothetical protein EJ02DRAFT_459542 [Clathrospora elynae]|uniref:DUF7730 domain-containing protein n=1 Tax=Clathrospora elynae TaxID=706981 RepID=A0A6A5S745_9PLEO|nr:hypothetical protein EJ02DRAFT_459542 [Clathrospora elynae]